MVADSAALALGVATAVANFWLASSSDVVTYKRAMRPSDLGGCIESQILPWQSP